MIVAELALQRVRLAHELVALGGDKEAKAMLGEMLKACLKMTHRTDRGKRAQVVKARELMIAAGLTDVLGFARMDLKELTTCRHV
jgi:hypothetical protein